MRLLALDIGGTNSRFADCTILTKSDFKIEKIFSVETKQADINSFQDLINNYNSSKPEPFISFNDYDVVSIAVAGPVKERQCSPPNISWDINLNDIPSLPQTFIFNDFVAQAYAFLHEKEINKLVPVRVSDKPAQGNTAVIGAGTGLGHCLIAAKNTNLTHKHVIASEAGHSGFTFKQDEQDIEAFFQTKTGHDFLFNDLIVSGSGLCLLHEYISGRNYSAKDVFMDSENNVLTLKYFSRFYARACRNYCLSNYVTDKLIISGGLAAKYPELIKNRIFLDEFETIESYGNILKNISIYLNKNEYIGLSGACYYALLNQTV